MTADLLREAAEEMRADAKPYQRRRGPDVGGLATYITKQHRWGPMSPAVALAVADWLDKEAELDDLLKLHAKRGIGEESHCMKVARAYLGRDL